MDTQSARRRTRACRAAAALAAACGASRRSAAHLYLVSLAIYLTD